MRRSLSAAWVRSIHFVPPQTSRTPATVAAMWRNAAFFGSLSPTNNNTGFRGIQLRKNNRGAFPLFPVQRVADRRRGLPGVLSIPATDGPLAASHWRLVCSSSRAATGRMTRP